MSGQGMHLSAGDLATLRVNLNAAAEAISRGYVVAGDREDFAATLRNLANSLKTDEVLAMEDALRARLEAAVR